MRSSFTKALRGNLLMGLLALSPLATAAVELDDGGKVELTGDFRLRLENDWDSVRADGSERDDRLRARIRVRLALTWQISDIVSFGTRIRSGSDQNHQTNQITIIDFDGNATGDADFNFDRWYLKAEKGRLWAWVGRNSHPFWGQDELLLDDDATPAGFAGGYSGDLGEKGSLSLNLGYFAMPIGMQAFSSKMGAGQLVYESSGDRAAFTLAAGLYRIRADPDNADAGLHLMNNGFRDYQTWIGSAQVRLKVGGRPLMLGLDLMHNSEGYSPDDPDPITAAHHDQTDGAILLVHWGQAREKGQWLVGYHYARVETFAVSSSYAQDDWVRWGSSVESRSSNMKGHELRFIVATGSKSNLTARLFLVDSVTSVEDGNRFRVDFNYRF